ncbi:hypothetical protein [uncultured Bacteroides sp.]|uniref:hypothetical protein n=1 Tax=uncultured Bacteroides sp. TaxID=162156 RepID=UPI002AAAD3CC|nr:hypothetical protein [uncultured Bacteroides sp.]
MYLLLKEMIKKHPNPCVDKHADITFGGQSTSIFPIHGMPDKYIFMADIWRPKNLIDARYIWLPIQFDKKGAPFLKWMMGHWTADEH